MPEYESETVFFCLLRVSKNFVIFVRIVYSYQEEINGFR
jgi:hypothetical protein